MRTKFAVSIAAFLLLAAWGRAGAQQEKSSNLGASLFATAPLESVQDDGLGLLVDALRADRIVPKDGTVFALQTAQPMEVVPLEDLNDSTRKLFLYYLPEARQYFFLQVTSALGRPEMRFWSRGDTELVASADGIALLPHRSAETLRFTPAVEELAIGSAVEPLTIGDTIACIGRSLGIEPNLTSLTNTLASAVCTGNNVASTAIELVETVCNCLSIPGLGSNLVFATFGCVNGIAKLISCGIVSCTQTPGSCLSSIALNSQASGVWSSDCAARHRSGHYAKYYTFTLTTASQVQIDLRSGEDTYLYLLSGSGVDGSIVAQDDDGGDGNNSRFNGTLQAGTYTVEATTYASGRGGNFTVAVAATPIGGGSCLSSIPFNSSLAGSWTSACRSTHRSSAYYAKFYTFTLSATTTVTIDLRSAVDTYLYLLRGSGTGGSIVAADDDGGDGTNSRLRVTLAAGSYTLEATTYASGATGSFSVSVAR
jgi:pre-peptidase